MIRHNLAFSEYLASPAISKSFLDLIGRAPKLAKAYRDGTYKREETPAMRLGSLIHCAVLEPDQVSARYIAAPECDRRTKEGKAIYADFVEEANGKQVVAAPDWDTAWRCADSVRAHPMVEAILHDGNPEVSVFAELAGEDCKGRMDWLRADGIVSDLKTTRDATPDGFSRSCANFDYPVQAAMYLDLLTQSGYEATDFVFVAIETVEPYLCATYSLSPSYIRKGRSLYRQRLAVYRSCMDRDEWHGINHDIISQLTMPGFWAFGIEETADDY